ncbi:Hypothetical predicted protein [Olea europaea subsp. europaea]|uniref:Pentatricopeptide repeat-containing protein n=1 Tax=Olea europaea subsp. europaea TaxID=158383 RepID=A0A8S0TMC4_OLEEU|nr:Hypothetical predicted protein [Olea europaea subsp. europaea]
MFACHRASRIANSNVIRNLSSASTSKRTTRATSIADRDTFGTLSQSGSLRLNIHHADRNLPEDPSGYDKEEFDIEPRKNAYYYKYEISHHARQGAPGLRRALELFQEMKSKDRLAPTIDNFSPLLYGCAKAGYTKRAFELYEEFLKYDPKPSNSMVTCLINSCAESPFPEYGLERLRWFLPHIKAETNKKLNELHYNCAIKAFGKLGQLEEASRLVQEMIDEGITPTISTFNMLLIGCASHKEAGCSIAFRVFKRAKMFQLRPTVVTYRLLLRCIRDCGMGSPELVEATLKELPAVTGYEERLKYQSQNKRWTKGKTNISKRIGRDFTWVPLLCDIGASIKEAVELPKSRTVELPAKSDKSTGDRTASMYKQYLSGDSINLLASTTEVSSDLPTTIIVSPPKLPNLLLDDHLNLVTRIRSIKLDSLVRARDRLLLFGGLYGYLEAMMRDGCKPDIKTFSLMLDCIETTPENYLAYHKLAGDMKIERDLLFYDLLIRHICSFAKTSNPIELALDFIEKMHLDDIRPNISTFESLARGCSTWSLAKRLLDDINKCGFIASEVLIDNLFQSAISKMHFHLLSRLIEHAQANNFQPNLRLIESLERLRIGAWQDILRLEKNPNDEAKKYYDDLRIRRYDEFRIKLNRWLKNTDIRQEEHPWSQFKVDTRAKSDGFRKFQKHLNAMEKVKRDAFEKGQDFGNLAEEAKKLVESQA